MCRHPSFDGTQVSVVTSNKKCRLYPDSKYFTTVSVTHVLDGSLVP